LKVWRLVKARHVSTAYSGEEGLFAGGRWLPKGHLVVYTSENASLAVVENLVHADPDDLVGDYFFVAANVPDALLAPPITEDLMPAEWRKAAAYEACREIGLRWTTAGEYAALPVPSAVVPQETNLLLNPRHSDFAKIELFDAIRYRFDDRLV